MHKEAIDLLKQLIETPSISRSEKETADILEQYLSGKGFKVNRKYNNVWVYGKKDLGKPTVLLNSHHDTVKPVSGWIRNPFKAELSGNKIYGLGSNDAGASLVSLLTSFLYFCENKNNAYNLIFSATAEEEVSGKNGISSIIDEIGKIDFAIVGEPTGMQPAIAEKGLMVLDCEAHGISGHAARNEGENAIYIAIKDINRVKQYQFSKCSALLGDVKLSVTQINAGTQHNVVPDKCSFVIDVRTNERYTNKEVFEVMKFVLQSEVKARSFRLNSSSISEEHEIVVKAKQLGLIPFGSPTLSDQALLNVPSLKMGPGKSKRSHTADEYIRLSEIKNAIETYINLLKT